MCNREFLGISYYIKKTSARIYLIRSEGHLVFLLRAEYPAVKFRLMKLLQEAVYKAEFYYTIRPTQEPSRRKFTMFSPAILDTAVAASLVVGA